MKPSDLVRKLKSHVNKDEKNLVKLQAHFGFSSSGTVRHWIDNAAVPKKHRDKLEAYLRGK